MVNKLPDSDPPIPLDNKQLARAAKHMEYNKDAKPKKAAIIEKIVKDIKS